MLNLKKQQVDEFRRWKEEHIEKINFMQEVIISSDPKFEENAFYNVLEKIKCKINAFEVEEEKAKAEHGEITSELALGFYMGQMYAHIETMLMEHQNLRSDVWNVFMDFYARMKKIFEI